jgi:hypothetical protein
LAAIDWNSIAGFAAARGWGRNKGRVTYQKILGFAIWFSAVILVACRLRATTTLDYYHD